VLPLDTHQIASLNGVPQLNVTPSVENTPLIHETN